MRGGRRAALALAAVLASLGPVLVYAQEYPVRPVRLIVGFSAGGSSDVIARIYADHLSRLIGRQVNVENKPGAATNIASELLIRAEPDGYTLMLGTSQALINTVFGPAPSFDAITAFSPIGTVAEVPLMVAAHPGVAVASAHELIVKARLQRLTIGSAQFDPQVKLLSTATGISVDPIPYRGGAQALTAALGGEVSLVIGGVTLLAEHVKAGKLRAVGIGTSVRVSTLPDVPTFAEQGYPGFVTALWYSSVAPIGTPATVLTKLSAATLKITNDPQFIARVRAAGGEPLSGNAEDVRARERGELKLWVELAKESKK